MKFSLTDHGRDRLEIVKKVICIMQRAFSSFGNLATRVIKIYDLFALFTNATRPKVREELMPITIDISRLKNAQPRGLFFFFFLSALSVSLIATVIDQIFFVFFPNRSTGKKKGKQKNSHFNIQLFDEFKIYAALISHLTLIGVYFVVRLAW